MKIFGIMLIKDEIDIIRSTLAAARDLFDRIIVIDNGSSDGTWEVVKELESEVITPWKQDLRPYSNGLRADVFNAFKHEAIDGDWWCYKMDADEFYVDSPREFLSSVPPPYHTVYKRSIDYVITDKDLEEHQYVGEFEADRAYLRYFQPVAYTEPRFFKHRSKLVWKPGTKSPQHMGIRWYKPITVKHYQWRSPQQIQHRLDVRHQVRVEGKNSQFRHITQRNWKEVIKDHKKMLLDEGRSTYNDVPLKKNIKLSWYEYAIKRFLHGAGIYP